MSEENKITPGGEAGGADETVIDDKEPAAPTEFEISGKKYTAEALEEAVKLAEDHGHLVPEFTRKSQLLSEYEKLGNLDDLKKIIAQAEKAKTGPASPEIEEARKILKEQLGVVTKEDFDELKKTIDGLQQSNRASAEKAEDSHLEEITKTLSEKYSGKKGEPPFKIEEIAKAVKQNPTLAVYVQVNDQYLIDLEQTYKRIFADFWDKIPDIKAKPVKTERGSGPQSNTPANQKEADSEGERIEDAVNFFKSSGQGE